MTLIDTPILERYEDGERAEGGAIEVLSHALLAASNWDHDFNVAQRVQMITALLPYSMARYHADTLMKYNALCDTQRRVRLIGELDMSTVFEIEGDQLTPEHQVEIERGEAAVLALNLAVAELYHSGT